MPLPQGTMDLLQSTVGAIEYEEKPVWASVLYDVEQSWWLF